MSNILVVDDERDIRESLRGILEEEGYHVLLAESGEACLEQLKHKNCELVLLDIWLKGMDGLDTLERIRQMENCPEVIMISGHGTIETAVKATKLGAFDFLEKPLSLDKTLILIKNALDAHRLRRENSEFKKQVQARSVIVGESIPMKALRQQIAVMAPTNGRVLIYGESGTGKELVALAIHASSPRKDNLFVEVNCAAIPEDWIESELFGHRKGALPGAAGDKEGKFEKADSGTLFLDEVGDMSLKTQSKVLRALDEQRFTRVGDDEPTTVDVRVIAATNKDLAKEIAEGRFREDLFYRLNVVEIRIPSLASRREDIPLLADHFLRRFAAKNAKSIQGFSAQALQVIENYAWPGNVRELEHAIERAVVLTRAEVIEAADLPETVRKGPIGSAQQLVIPIGTPMDEIERRVIHETLRHTKGDKNLAAQLLGIAARTIYRKLERESESADDT